MTRFDDTPGMVPYPLIFPESGEGVVGLTLPVKVGKAKAGEYSFIEAYCVEKDCDCRRVAILVANAKGKRLATIEFGFDPDDPLAGPFLGEAEKPLVGAEDLLLIFVDAINDNPAWLKAMYKHYRQVRKQMDGHAYRGKAFPKPGSVMRTIQPPREEENPFAAFQKMLEAAVRTPPSERRRPGARPTQGELFPTLAAPEDMPALIERYRRLTREEDFSRQRGLQNELRHYLFDHEEAGDDLARLLVKYFTREAADEEFLDGALRLLFDAMDILRVEVERQRPEARQRMEAWQKALARNIYAEGVDPQLGAEVTQILLNARVEILPLLHEANSRRMFASVEADPDFSADPERAMFDLLDELERAGAGNPHDLFEAVLQMMAVGDVEVQVKLCQLMLGIEHPVIREAGVLMLFHPQAEVRSGVGRILAEARGTVFTPASLRRLIVARNWFPEPLRRRIDQAVANARRARVECAPLTKMVGMTIYASGVDGAMAQTFQVLVPAGKGFLCCSIMPKRGSGVADAFLIPLAGRRERDELLTLLRQETGAVEVAPEYLDRRMCQALADGSALGKVPPHWLAAIAEQLGRDQWKAVPFDASAELAGLRVELERRGGRFVTERFAREALMASGAWPDEQPFAHSWFEDDVAVDETVEKTLRKNRKKGEAWGAVTAVLNEVLSVRRQPWLERLTLTTLWLKAAKKPPLPWEQLFYVAEALADGKTPLREIPLLVSIAENSFHACMARRAEAK